MVYSDTDGELLAEHNIVKANPEDDVFQNMAWPHRGLFEEEIEDFNDIKSRLYLTVSGEGILQERVLLKDATLLCFS